MKVFAGVALRMAILYFRFTSENTVSFMFLHLASQ